MPYKDSSSIEAKESQSRRNKKYYRNNKVKLLKTRRPTRKKYYKEHKEKWSNASTLSTINRRKRLYGVDDETYNKMLNNQKEKCAICGCSKHTEKRGLFVDHCHKTGIVRGLLCTKCNLGLGSFSDDIKLLYKAIIYLSI